MITLSNGDRWIIDDSEYKDLPYEEAKLANIPETDIKDFVHQLCSGDYNIPRKWTPEFDGYWDANFDPYKEVLGHIAPRTLVAPWATVYEMPWGEVIVVYYRPDCGGYDVETGTKIYSSVSEYMRDATL